jgi:hypothetical protein
VSIDYDTGIEPQVSSRPRRGVDDWRPVTAARAPRVLGQGPDAYNRTKNHLARRR